ncbi:hypothetical protein ABXT44_05000 [Candidatus Pseudothioglobus sp. Uisw_041]|jgi:hypothetical protein|uniref:hypothetical protein n=1 Tax=Candidatus Pseudothioglobus sp. Uisw_041 TaxID=3230996 RepID=UPI003A8A33AC
MQDNKIECHDGEFIETSKEEILDGINKFNIDEEHYDQFPAELWKDVDIIFSCLKAEHIIDQVFASANVSLWTNREFILNALDKQWYYPNISRQFKDNKFEYFDYIHESLRGDKKIISLIDKLRKHSKEFDD